MSKSLICKKIGVITVAAFICALSVSISAVKAQTSCVNLPHDLYSGLSDSGSDDSILALQNYLKSLGYLPVVPNGHFGPATLSAVKEYQTVNGISATGYIGPLTRAAIKQKTCVSGTAAPAASAGASVPIPAAQPVVSNPVPVSAPVPSNMTVTSPATGQVLPIGKTILIKWSSPVSGIYNISLEQPGGAGAGFIALSQSSNFNGNQYLWSAGKIFISQTGSYQNIPAGTYRIRLQSGVSGASPSDPVSGWFTVTAPQFTASSVAPSSAFADNSSSVVLSGTGFTSSVSIYFDADYSSLRATNEYVSPDGTVVVFTVPTNVPSGPHTLFIDNGQSSSPVSLPFTVSAI